MDNSKFVEPFFAASIQELEKRRNGTLYDLIRASGLLRQLIVDGNASLMLLANRNYKLKLKFRVRDSSLELSEHQTQWWGRPNVIASDKEVLLSLDNFLQYSICIYNEHTYTIKDLILYFAYLLGGIHSGIPDGLKEKTFLRIHRIFDPILKDWPSASIVHIIDIVIEAASPLVEAIAKVHTPSGGL